MRLSGHERVFPLSTDAHSELLHYLAEARTALADDPDGDETLRDIEAAVGEQLTPLCAGAGQPPVSRAQMRTVLAQAGSISTESTGTRSDAPVPGRYWARITEGGWLGGVCLGVAARGGFDAAWVRGLAAAAVFVVAGVLAPLGQGVPMLLFLAAVALGYLVLMLVLPAVGSVDRYARRAHDPSGRHPGT